jgi:hypothetical protein
MHLYEAADFGPVIGWKHPQVSQHQEGVLQLLVFRSLQQLVWYALAYVTTLLFCFYGHAGGVPHDA